VRVLILLIVQGLKQHLGRMNDEVVMLPRVMTLLPLVRALPVPIQDFLLSLVGVHDTMDDFKGRMASKKSN